MAAVGVLFFIVFFGVWLAALVYWIVALIEVARTPDYQFRAAGTDKTVWILVVVLAQIIGALIWRFTMRRAVLAATGGAAAPPPGWYPEPETAQLRWWDGQKWSEHRQPPPQPPIGSP